MCTRAILAFAVLLSALHGRVLNAEQPILNPGCLVILFEATPAWSSLPATERDRLLAAHSAHWQPFMKANNVPRFRVSGLTSAPYAEALIKAEHNPDDSARGYLQLASKKDPAVIAQLFTVRTFSLFPIGTNSCDVSSTLSARPAGG